MKAKLQKRIDEMVRNSMHEFFYNEYMTILNKENNILSELSEIKNQLLLAGISYCDKCGSKVKCVE